MQHLRLGDHLPTVVTVQKTVGAAIDGEFGVETLRRVRSWQAANGLAADGVVGRNSWMAMMRALDLVTIDVVDGTDPSLLRIEAADIRRDGGNLIVLTAISNGVAVMVNEVIARLRRYHSLALLRIHSHGGAGLMNVSAGQDEASPHQATIAASNLPALAPHLRRLAPCFARHGALQLMGCDVAQGPAGRALLRQLAAVVGVPVSAGTGSQYGGGRRTYRFEGPVQHGFPFGNTLSGWARMATA